MEVIELVNSGLKREYKVVIPYTEISSKIEAKIADLTKVVKLPGFREGKVPVSLIKKKYSNDVTDEVINDVIEQSFLTLLKDKSVQPAHKPLFKISDFVESKDLEYVVSFEILPEIEDYDFSKITLERYNIEIADEDLQEALSRVAEMQKTFAASPGKKAQSGDAVLINFEGKIDGVPFEGGKAEDYQLTLGSNQFIPGFEDQLIGTQAGDSRVVTVTFPENYGAATLAGKESAFDVTVKEVLEAKNPEVNDDLAKSFGLENLDALREALKSQLDKEYKEATYLKVKKELFDLLEKEITFPIPESMVKTEFDTLWARVQQEKEHNKEASSTDEEELRKEYLHMSERRVRLGIFLAELGKKHQVSVSQDELRQAIYEQARQFPGQEHKVIEFYRKHPASLEDLKGPILENKVVEFILGKVSLEEKPISGKAFRTMFNEADSSTASA